MNGGLAGGAVSGLDLNRLVANLMLKRTKKVVLLVKGARSYEMIPGINKIAYFLFAVCREISESVTGVDAKTGLPVCIRQEPGLPSFQGFRQRHTREYPLYPTNRVGWAASMTTREYLTAIGSKQCYKIINKFNGNQLRAARWIVEQSTKKGLTVAEFILNSASSSNNVKIKKKNWHYLRNHSSSPTTIEDFLKALNEIYEYYVRKNLIITTLYEKIGNSNGKELKYLERIKSFHNRFSGLIKSIEQEIYICAEILFDSQGNVWRIEGNYKD
ncbi:MAG: hypothetical protein ABIH08_07820 [Candidatus Omnitrophota bacterium]